MSRSRSPRRHQESPRRSVSPAERKTADPEARGDRDREPAPMPTTCRLYVGNLPFTTTHEDYMTLLSSAGKVVSAELLSSFGRPKGCGVVEYEDMKAVENAMAQINGTSFGGRSLFLREDRIPERRPQRQDNNDNATVYVGNLPYSVSWQDLKDLFRDAGHVVRADVPQNADKQSKGFGVIVFERFSDVDRAISMFDGIDFQGRRIQVREDRNSQNMDRRPRQRSFSRSRSRSRTPPRRRHRRERTRSRSRSFASDRSRSLDRRDRSEERYRKRERRGKRHHSRKRSESRDVRNRTRSDAMSHREGSAGAMQTTETGANYNASATKDPKTGQAFMMPFPYGYYPFGFGEGGQQPGAANMMPGGQQPTPQQMQQHMQQMYMQQQAMQQNPNPQQVQEAPVEELPLPKPYL